MSNKDFYFKVKPKDSVKVTAAASIDIPFIDLHKRGDWHHGFGIPYQQSEPKGYFDEDINNYEGDISKALLSAVGINENTYSNATTENKEKIANKILRRELTAEKIFQDQYRAPVSFFAMYKSWDSTKFTNFVLENLVGKALTQALLYNYFGYPVSNIGRVQGRSGYAQNGQDPEHMEVFPPGSQTSYYDAQQLMGLLPSFGSSDKNTIDQTTFDFQTAIANLNTLLTENDAENSPDLDLRITQILAGSYGEGSAAGNSFAAVYSNSKVDSISPSNHLYDLDDWIYVPSYPWDFVPRLSTNSPYFKQEKWNTNFDAPDQNLTPTHAKMYMPGLESSVYPSLSGLMGGSQGVFTKKWYYGESAKDGEPEKYFKYSNLVSALKLVPPGIDPSQVQDYLDNPHKTLNEVIKNVFKYVAHVVPQNIRHAGPKPTIKEPGTDAVTGENKPEACEDLLSASQLEINRVVSGSFFELGSIPPVLNHSTTSKENYLGAKDPKDYNDYPGGALQDIYNNVLWGKGVSSLFTYNRYDKYGKDPNEYVIKNAVSKISSDIKEYSYKFGLPPTTFIGTENPYLFGTPADEQEAKRFAVIPRNKQSIITMFDSLPDFTRQTDLNGGNNLYIDFNKGTSEIFNYYNSNDIDPNNPLEVTRYITSLWLAYHFGSLPTNFYATLDKVYAHKEFKIDIPGATGGSDGWKGIYADVLPYILQYLTADRQAMLSYLKTSNMNISGLSGYSGIATGNSKNHFLNAFLDFFGNIKDVGEDATGTLYDVENILGAGDSNSVLFAAKNNVPYYVNHKSPLIFPVWDYKQNAGTISSYSHGNLSNIKWPKLINTNGNKGYKYDEEDSPWTPILEQDPFLKQKERKCVPDWCKSLQVYPTVKKEPLTYGFINPYFTLGTTQLYYGDNHLFTNKYLNDASLGDFSSNENTKNYKDENLSLQQKARPYIVVDYEYDTDIAKNPPPGSAFNEKVLDNFDEDTPTPALTTLTEYAKSTGLYVDWRDGVGSSQNYRNSLLAQATLTYAVDLEIDETKLIIDMIRHGVFAMAGEFDEYQEAGINPYDVFEAVGLNGQGVFYSQDLLSKYENYKSTLEGSLQGIDFSKIPSFLKGEDVSEEMLLAVDLNLPLINQKYDSLTENGLKPTEATSYVLVNQGQKVSPRAKATLKASPGSASRADAFLPNFTVIKVLKQWVNGVGDYNLVRVVDPQSDLNGLEGYIEINDIVSIKKNIFFEDIFGGKNGNLKLANLNEVEGTNGRLSITQMSEGQKAVIPIWWRNEVPYYHKEEGNWWYTVELEDTCVLSKSDLEEKKQQALRKGVQELFYWHNRVITDEQIESFIKTYLTCEIASHYIDIRPGENVKFLLKVGAIYLYAFPSAYKSLSDLKKESSKILTLDTRYYVKHLSQAGYGLNQMYLNILKSEFRVQGVNFMLEAERMDKIPVLFKKLISFNGYTIASEEQNLINIGFDNEFNIIFISYNEGAKEGNEKLLSTGLDYIKQQEPFNVKNTMSLFYHHRQLKNPLLKWQQAIKEIFLDPKPEIIPKEESTLPDIPSSKCKPLTWNFPSWQELLGPIAGQLDDALKLDPRFDLGSFQFSLTDYLPPCPSPPSGKGGALFKGEIETEAERMFFDSFDSLAKMKDLQTGYKEYVGDFMTSAEGLRSIGDKAIDLNSLYDQVLRRVGGLDTIYMKICKCFLDLAGLDTVEVPNFKVDLQGPSAGLNIKPLSYIPSADSNAPANTSITGGQQAGWNKGDEYEYDMGSFGSADALKDSFNNKPTEFDAADLICSFCFEVPDFFLRLPTTNLLDSLIDALLKALEYILAQILVELFATLLELLLRCPELTCPEGVKRVSDYGAQNLNNLLASPGIGDSPAVFESCGVSVTNVNDIEDLLDDISKVLSSGEVLELLDGTSDVHLMKIIQKKVDQYPSIASQLDNTAKTRDFFRCVGFKVPPQKLAEIEDDIIKVYQDPDVCDNIFEKAKDDLRSKCGDLENVDDLVKQATEVDVQNYITLANLIRKIPDLTQQIPPLFSDNKGNKGILSGLPNPTIEDALETTLKNMLLGTNKLLKEESIRFTNPKSRVMVKMDYNREELLNNSPLGNLFFAPLNPLTFALGGVTAWAAFIYGGGGTELSENDFWSPWFPIADKMAPYAKDARGVDEILTDFGLDFTKYITTYGDNNIRINIQMPEFQGSKVRTDLQFSPPDTNEDGNLIYTNNLRLFFETPQILEGTFSLNDNDSGGETSKKVSDSLAPILDKYPLKDGNIPPQNQYFASLLADKILPDSNMLSSEAKNKFINETYNIFAIDLYKNIFSSILAGIAETIGNSETLDDYEIDLFDELIQENPLGTGWILVLRQLWDLAQVDIKAKTTKKELGLLDLTPNVSNQGFSQGLIDMQRVYDISKEKYDFADYEDPNSNELGMPQFAMLEGIVSAYIQMVAGEVSLRAITTICKFPKYIITQGDMLTELILKILNQMLDESGFKNDFSFICMTLLSRRSEFRFKDPNKNLPGNSGFILDKKNGTDVEINSSDDAVRFLIKENLEYPLDFIYSRLGIFKGSGQSFSKISQANPLDFISYNAPVWVHDESHQTEFDKPPKNPENGSVYDYPSSFFSNNRYKEFLNGKFVNQIYYEVEDWADKDEAQNNGGIWLSYLHDENVRSNKLRKVLSQDNLFELIALTADMVTTEEGEQYADESFIKFFKSIKLGTRLCYVFITSEREWQGSSSGIAGFEDVQEFIKPYSDGQSETLKTVSKAIDDALGIKVDSNSVGSTYEKIDENFKQYIDLNKSILVIEDDLSLKDEKSKTSKNPPAKTYIFPVIESSVDMMNNDTGQSFELFNEPVSVIKEMGEENIVQFLFEPYGQGLLVKNLTNIVLSDEYSALMMYSFPTKDMIDLFVVTNVAIVSADKKIKDAFVATKSQIKTLFESIYNMVGPAKYKKLKGPYG